MYNPQLPLLDSWKNLALLKPSAIGRLRMQQHKMLFCLDHRVQSIATQVQNIDKKIDSIDAQLEQMYIDFKNKVTHLDSELRQIIQQRYWGPEFDKKEADIRKLLASYFSPLQKHKPQPLYHFPLQHLLHNQPEYTLLQVQILPHKLWINILANLVNNMLHIQSLCCT